MKQYFFPLVLVGAGLAVIACFLPWYVGASDSLSGFRGEKLGNPGFWCIGLVVLRIMGLWWSRRWGRTIGRLAGALLLISALFYLKTAIRLEEAGPGIGIFLLLLASVTMLLPGRKPPKML